MQPKSMSTSSQINGEGLKEDPTALPGPERRLRLYETILDNTPDLIYVFGLDHRFVYANAALLAMWGRTWDDAIGKTCLEIGYEPWHAAMHDREIEQVIATKRPIRGVVPFDGTNGRRMYDYIFVPVFGEDGQVEAIAGTTRDVTERIASEEAMRESEARYRTLFETMDEGFCIVQMLYDDRERPVDYRYVETNPAFERQSGLRDARGKTVREIVPEVSSEWIDAFGDVVRTGTPTRTVRQARSTGRWYELNAFRTGDPAERKVAVLFNDVTDRKRREANLAFLAEVDRDFVRLTSPAEIMATVGAKVGAFLDLAGCNFCQIDEPADRLTIDYGWGNDEVPNLLRRYRLSEYLTEEFARASRDGKTVVIRDTQDDARVDSVSYARLHIGSFVTVPFHRNAEWTGLFAVVDSHPREWREDELELLRELANRIFPRLERALAEEALRRSEERFRAAVGAIGVLWTSDAEGRMRGEQPGWTALTGQSQAEYEDQGWAAALHPDDARSTLDAWERAVRERRTFVFEHRVRRRDGQWRRFSVRAVPVLDAETQVREWVGVHIDITETREHERALREGEAQYRQIAEGLPQMVWSAGPDGVRDYFNGRWLEFTGVGLDNDANPWAAVLHPNDRARALARWRHSVETGETFQAEYQLRARDGRYRWFLGRAIALRNHQGRIVRWFGTCTDIDDQKTTQHVLQITNDFATALAQDLDLERIVQSLTDASKSAIGAEFGAFFYTAAEEATGTPPMASHLAVPVLSRSGDPIGGLVFGHRQPGMFTEEHERIVVSFAAQAAVAIDNARLYEQVRSINEELEQKVEARTADLLSAVERLQGFTYLVSHDLRAPLRGIVSTSRIIQEDFGANLPSEASRLLDRQAEAGRKLGQLVDDLLKLSRLSRQEMVRQSIDFTFLARDAAAEALSTHPYSTVRVEVADGLWAEGDPRLLRLALLNLIENAVKYSPDGGLVTVGRREDGTFFVQDHGIGIEDQYLHKIFEPFQRLHRDEEFGGTGIGLANVRQIVERHGGKVWAESEPGQGSTFSFNLG